MKADRSIRSAARLEHSWPDSGPAPTVYWVNPGKSPHVCLPRSAVLVASYCRPGFLVRVLLFFGRIPNIRRNYWRECNESLQAEIASACRRIARCREWMDRPPKPARAHEMLQGGLDLLDQGITVFDGDLRLVAGTAPSSSCSISRTSWPASAHRSKASSATTPSAANTAGRREVQIAQRVAAAATSPHVTERQRPNGRVLLLRRTAGAPWFRHAVQRCHRTALTSNT